MFVYFMNLDDNIDLINLVKEETLNINIDTQKVFKCFTKCLSKIICDLCTKFKNIKNFDYSTSILLGSNMFFNVFWILISYSNNVKLSIFLAERSILLYTEFILMSKDSSIDSELYFKPTILDAITFSYKKTIGHLKIKFNNSKNLKRIEKIKDQSKIIEIILIEYVNSENFEIDKINDLNLYIFGTVNMLFQKKDNIFYKIFDIIVNIFKQSNDYLKNILFIKIFMELLVEFDIDINRYETIYNKFYKLYSNRDIKNITDLKNTRKMKTSLLK